MPGHDPAVDDSNIVETNNLTAWDINLEHVLAFRETLKLKASVDARQEPHGATLKVRSKQLELCGDERQPTLCTRHNPADRSCMRDLSVRL
jgi:hypothetical protein